MTLARFSLHAPLHGATYIGHFSVTAHDTANEGENLVGVVGTEFALDGAFVVQNRFSTDDGIDPTACVQREPTCGIFESLGIDAHLRSDGLQLRQG